MKKRTFLSLSLTSFLLSTGMALAATDAELVKVLADQIYARQKEALLAGGSGLTLKEIGTLTVTEKGKYFNVTYPALSISQEKMRMEIGPIQANMMPDSNPAQWKMTLAIPSPIRISGIDKGETIDLNIGAQKFSAIVDEKTLFPRMVDARYDNLSVTGSDTKSHVRLGDITLKADYTEEQPGLLSGPFSLGLTNLSINGKGAEKFTIGSLTMEGGVNQLDVAMIRTYNQKMSELYEGGFDPEKVASPESMAAMWKIVMDYGLSQMDGVKLKMAIKDIDFNEGTPKEPGQPAQQFKLGELGYTLDASGIRSEKSRADFSFTLNGLSTNGAPAEFEKYLPKTMNLALGYKDLPHKALMQQLGSLATAVMKMEGTKTADCATGKDADCVQSNTATAQMLGMQALMTVPALLAQAGTTFTINNTDIRAADYGVNVNGKFAASSQAVFGGTGNAKIIFTGLDQLITDLQALATKPDTKPFIAGKATEAAQGLAAMQLFGQQGTDAGGKPARIYDFTVDDKGAMKMNGTDMSALMGPKNGDLAAPDSTPPTTP